MTDANICDCGWEEIGPNLNPNRQKCPECGAPFFDREELAGYLFDRAVTHDMGFWDRLRLAAYCAAWVNGDGVEQYVTDGSEADAD